MAYMVGLDMGTTYTRIWTQEGGIVLRCPSAAAIDSETHKLVALGAKAKEMLAMKMPVAVVAHQLGFSSSQHFSNHFRSVTGVSPTGYRPD